MPEQRFQPLMQANTQTHANARLQHAIRASALLEMNAEDLYAHLAEAAEANPVLVLSRTDVPQFPQSTFSRSRHSDQSAAKDSDQPSEPLGIAAFPSRHEQTLQEYLLRQVPFLSLKPPEEKIVRYIIAGLDDSGYFSDSISTVAKHFRTTEQEALSCLRLVQTLEPAGVAARDLQECLLLQLHALPTPAPLALEIVQKYWPLLAAQPQVQLLASRLQQPPSKIREALRLIHKLNPKPSNGFSTSEMTAYVTPDAYLIRRGDALEVMLTSCYTLEIDKYYQQLQKETTDPEVHRYLSTCLQQANQLFQGLQKREALLKRLLTLLVQEQRRFFDGGEKKPLLQKQAAQILGLHPSTVSRAVQNKYLYYWDGLIPVQALFDHNSSRNSGVSSNTVLRVLQQLIAQEDRRAPFSDEALRQKLEAQGISLSRRMVTKYRGLLEIPSSHARRLVSAEGTPEPQKTREQRL